MIFYDPCPGPYQFWLWLIEWIKSKFGKSHKL